MADPFHLRTFMGEPAKNDLHLAIWFGHPESFASSFGAPLSP